MSTLTVPARTSNQQDLNAPVDGPRRSAGRIVLALVGALLLVLGLGLGTAAVVALVADRGLRDDGYLTLAREDVSTAGYGVVLGDLVLDPGSDVPAAMIGELRLTVSPAVGQNELFAGIARTSDVEAYLGRRASTLRDGDMQRRMMPWASDGQAPTGLPADAGIWVESATGVGTQEITWAPTSGEWSLVVIRSDASAGVAADVEAAATLPWLDDVGPWLVGVALVSILTGGALVILAVRRTQRSSRRPVPSTELLGVKNR